MRLIDLALALILIAEFLPAETQFRTRARDDSRISDSIDRMRLDDLDVEPLCDHLMNGNASLSEEDLHLLIRQNIQFILFNKMNDSRFLVHPGAQRVADRILAILTLTDELGELILEGRRAAADSRSRDYRRVVNGIRDKARELRKGFNGYFVELHASQFVLQIPKFQDESVQFVHYIVQTDRIHRLLRKKLEEYFLSARPGQIGVSKYQETSIDVLCESLDKLSKEVFNRLSD